MRRIYRGPGAGYKFGGSRTLLLDFEAKNRTKVVNLLKDMLKQLEKEAEEDEEIYDQLACWCETNDKGKTKSIADAETRINDLTVQIEELSAASSRLNTEIKNVAEVSLMRARTSLMISTLKNFMDEIDTEVLDRELHDSLLAKKFVIFRCRTFDSCLLHFHWRCAFFL